MKGAGERGCVVVVDDDADMAELIALALDASGYRSITCSGAEPALAALSEHDVDAVVTDLNMPGMNGLEFCERVASNRPDLPIIIVTAHANLETAISSMRCGADDFVTKPLQVDALVHRVDKAVRGRRLRDEVKRLREVIDERKHFGEMLGTSPPMRAVFDLLARVVDSDASVLITGESGTGKELVAQALHHQGRRSEGPFVAINCSAMPAALLESELFGHAKGAFTGADGAREGLFVRANGGTLFLDEIGEMPVELQPKILRALQERSVRPVGGTEEIAFDVRIVAATNRDLESSVEDGRFREDLYFRINVIHVALPPLRARGRDILAIAQHFVDKVSTQEQKSVKGISSTAAEKLLNYTWPGNVRELRNCIERAVVLTRTTDLIVDDLPEKIRDYRTSHVLVSSEDPSELVPMEAVERRYIAKVLAAVGGNKSHAAKTLGFDRKTLYRKLERYQIEYEPPDV